MKRDYYRIVVYVARVHNMPNMTWADCKKFSLEAFRWAGLHSPNYKLLKDEWKRFSKAKASHVYARKT